MVSEKITSNVHQGVGGRGQADLSSNSTSTIHSLSDLCKLISWRLSFLIYELVIMNSLSKYLISTSTVKDTGNRGEYESHLPCYTTVKKSSCKSTCHMPGRELGIYLLFIKCNSFCFKYLNMFLKYFPYLVHTIFFWGFPDDLACKETACRSSMTHLPEYWK